MFFVTECLWLQGCKPSELIADVENIVRVYRGNLQPDGDSRTQNLGTTVAGSTWSWASLRLMWQSWGGAVVVL